MLPPYVLHLGCAWIGWQDWLYMWYQDVYMKGRWLFPPISDIILYLWEPDLDIPLNNDFVRLVYLQVCNPTCLSRLTGTIHTFFVRGICSVLICILRCPRNTSTHQDPSFQIHLLDSFVFLKFLLHHFLWLSYHQHK